MEVFEYEHDVIPLNDTYEYQQRKRRSSSPGAYPLEQYEYSYESEEEQEQEQEEEIDSVLPRKFAELRGPPKPKDIVARLPPSSPSALRRLVPSFKTFLLACLTAGILSLIVSYRQDSRYIGYCDAGRDTNLRIEEIQRQRQAIKEEAIRCAMTFNASAPLECSPVPPQRPFEALSCTPCPKRAACTPESVTCNPPLITKPHPLGDFSNLASGLPLFGSVAFPPTCVEDSEKLKMIQGTSRKLDQWLAKVRGDKICEGAVIREDDGGEAKAYGFEHEALRETLRQKRVKVRRSLYTGALLKRFGIVAHSKLGGGRG